MGSTNVRNSLTGWTKKWGSLTHMVFLQEFGLKPEEITELRSIAEETVNADKSILSRHILDHASPETSRRIRTALTADRLRSFSEVGEYTIVSFYRDAPGKIQSLEGLLRNFLVDPLVYRSIVAWCFLFALQESSANFQLDHCRSPTSEGILSGSLLTEISRQCEAWRKIASGPLNRVKTILSLDRIDLSILGGEQATGGDFGLILQFDDGGTQPAMQKHARTSNSRIVPLIFQAKRYVRPMADVSQRHAMRGYQHTLLRRNKCAAAYIFYENASKLIRRPVPALIKPADKVSYPTRTDVFEDSLDLPGYLFKALYDPLFAPSAVSPIEALRMIYAGGDANQLANLAVISNSSTASERYTIALAELERDLRSQKDQRADEEPPRN